MFPQSKLLEFCLRPWFTYAHSALYDNYSNQLQASTHLQPLPNHGSNLCHRTTSCSSSCAGEIHTFGSFYNILCFLTVTILSSTDLLVEELSTILDLTCTKSLPCVLAQALIEPLLMYFIYPFMYLSVALGNALHCCTFNLGSQHHLIFVLGFHLS